MKFSSKTEAACFFPALISDGASESMYSFVASEAMRKASLNFTKNSTCLSTAYPSGSSAALSVFGGFRKRMIFPLTERL